MKLSDGDKDFVLELLRKHLPAGTRVFFFGSRIRGDAKTYSDLDVAVDDSSPLDLRIRESILEDFAQSELTYKVDLSDFQLCDADFQKLILKSGVVFELK